MRDLAELTFLYPDSPLLVEIQDREIAIAQLTRKLAAADDRVQRLTAALRREKSKAPRNRRKAIR
jgi:hypothetical protein